MSARKVEGTIHELTCSTCRASFPHFMFSGDTDMVTQGLCAAGVCRTKQIALIEANAEEWSAIGRGDFSTIEARIANELGRDGFRMARLLRVEKSPPRRGLSFAAFRKIHTPPQLVYACPCCMRGEATKSKVASVRAFEKAGGLITTIGELALSRD